MLPGTEWTSSYLGPSCTDACILEASKQASNDEHRAWRSQFLFKGLVHNMFGTELPGNQGFQSFVQPIKSKSNENIRNRARQHRNQQNQPVVAASWTHWFPTTHRSDHLSAPEYQSESLLMYLLASIIHSVIGPWIQVVVWKRITMGRSERTLATFYKNKAFYMTKSRDHAPPIPSTRYITSDSTSRLVLDSHNADSLLLQHDRPVSILSCWRHLINVL